MTVLFLWPIVLVAAGLYDFAVTRYVVAVEARAGWRAGMWSVLTYLAGLIGTLGIIKVSPWLIIPECIGLLLGTVFGVAFKKDAEGEQPYEVYRVSGMCIRGQHLDPCEDQGCWSNSNEAQRERIRTGWYER